MKSVAALLAMMCIAAAPLKRIVAENGDTTAVVVPASAKLFYTRQYLTDEPLDIASAMQDSVKINVVARDLAAAERARKDIRRPDGVGERPAVSVVIGFVPDNKSLAIDGVLLNEGSDDRARIFISGQAEKGTTAVEAAAKTLAGLLETLKFVGSTREDVVQAKCFLTPMSARNDVIAEFNNAFGERRLSLIFVEWKSDLPIEIELVASGPPAAADAPAIEYLTPPGKSASPLFARIVRVNRGDLVFIGDIYAKEAGDGQAQVRSIFDQLQSTLKQTNSDLRHLVKATYYVSDEDASKQLNVMRPKFYDPARPPAASKAMVPGIGMANRSISVDMIAIPSTQPIHERVSTRRAGTGRK